MVINSKTQIMKNPKTQIVTKLKEIKFGQLKNSKCDKTQKLKEESDAAELEANTCTKFV